MSEFEVGTVVTNEENGHVFEYVYDPVKGKRDWRALDAPPILELMFGDEDGEIRFSNEEIVQRIAEGKMLIK